MSSQHLLDHPITFTIKPEDAGQRLDRWLATALPEHSRSEIQRWIKEGLVMVDGAIRATSIRMRATPASATPCFTRSRTCSSASWRIASGGLPARRRFPAGGRRICVVRQNRRAFDQLRIQGQNSADVPILCRFQERSELTSGRHPLPQVRSCRSVFRCGQLRARRTCGKV